MRAVARLPRHRPRVRPLRRARQRERSARRVADVLSAASRRRLPRHGRGQGRSRQGLAHLGRRRQAPPGALGLLRPGRLLRQDRRHAGLLRRALDARRAAARTARRGSGRAPRSRTSPISTRSIRRSARRSPPTCWRASRDASPSSPTATRGRARFRRALPRQLDRPARPRDDRSGAARSALVPDRQLRRTARAHRRDAAHGRALSRPRPRPRRLRAAACLRAASIAPSMHVAIRQSYAAMIENIDRWLGLYLEALDAARRARLDRRGVVERPRRDAGRSRPVGQAGAAPLVGRRCRWCWPGRASSPARATALVSSDRPRTDVPRARRARRRRRTSTRDRSSRCSPVARAGHREHVLSGLLGWRMVYDGRYKLVRGSGPRPRSAARSGPSHCSSISTTIRGRTATSRLRCRRWSRRLSELLPPVPAAAQSG